MKKNYLLYGVLVVVLIIASIVFFKNKSGTISKELKDFAFEDTSLVNKIFLANKNNETILLERISVNRWMVNKKFLARQDAIKNLLDAIASVQVKSPVPKTALQQINKLLATRATKVEIYANDKLVKTYYVGDPTPDNLGTYMILEGSSVPFVTHRPGFNGYLSIRYFVNEMEWRDVSIFPLSISQLYSISIHYPDNPAESFQIIRKSAGLYELFNSKNEKANYIDTLLVKETAIACIKAKIDQWITINAQHKIDSLKQSHPIAQIEVKSVTGFKHTLTLYKKTLINKISETEQEFELDPDVMYGLINDKELSLCQYFIFDPILLKFSDFTKDKDLVNK